MKNKPLVLMVPVLLLIMGCSNEHTAKSILNYIEDNNVHNATSFELDIGKAIGLEYDTLYIFNSSVPISGIRDVIGISQYRPTMLPEEQINGYDGESTILILVKNGTVIYDDTDVYKGCGDKLIIRHESFDKVEGVAIFDDKTLKTHGYRLSSQKVVVKCLQGKYYLQK